MKIVLTSVRGKKGQIRNKVPKSFGCLSKRMTHHWKDKHSAQWDRKKNTEETNRNQRKIGRKTKKVLNSQADRGEQTLESKTKTQIVVGRKEAKGRRW